MSKKSAGKVSLMARWRGLWPARMQNRWARLAAWVDLLVVDLGLLRAPVNRPVQIAPGLWRSNQPTPWRLKRLQRRGFATVINLRGAGHSGAYHLERYHCQALGLRLIDLKLSSRRPPTVDQVSQLKRYFDEAERPLLIHCKSGADRAGLVAALFLLFQGDTVEQVEQQLSLRYMHFRSAATGVLDHFLDCYKCDRAVSPSLTFNDWLEQGYDRNEVIRSFKPSGPARWLVDRLLRRE